MSGVGSTNAMKKGSANNPFLAFSEADMKGYLNSAYTGCIVKYTGDPIARNLSDINKTVPERAQSLVFNKNVPKANWGCLKITTKSNGTETVQYLRTLFYNRYTKEISWYNSSWIPFLAICNTQHPTSASDLGGLKILWVPTSYETNSDDYPEYWPVTLGWQGENADADGKVMLWGYSEDVSFVYLEDGKDSYISYDDIPCAITPYSADELYKVVYSNNEYRYEEFNYISEDKTTAGVEDVAPGKTFYDFAGTKQIGTGTRANPFLARGEAGMNAFNDATYLGKFVKYIGKTNDTYVKDAIYQVTNDATVYDRYMLFPTLENEGKASDLLQGKQLINSKGEIVVGAKEETTYDYTVKVIDYDGTVLLEKKGNTGDVIDLPAAPTHDKLVFQEWSASVAVSDNKVTIADSDIMVGAVYTTASGQNEFDITLTKVTGLSVTLNMNGTKDWGDGTSDTETSHTYTAYGDYTIKCNGTKMTTLSSKSLFGQKSNSTNKYCTAIRFSTVTSIGVYALQYCYSLTSVVISNSVTSIGERALQRCYALTSIVIHNGVTSIDAETFYHCYSLTSVVIPNSVISIDGGAFGSCRSLPSVVIPNSVTSIGDSAFSSCYALTNVVIPNSVTSIGVYAFNQCYSLTSVVILGSVTSIGKYAFRDCHALTNVVIPNSVTSIGSNSFQSCYSLTSFVIPSGVTSIGDSAFSTCYVLKKYDFSQCTAVPTLATTDSLYGINGICKIIVPDSLYDEWIAASNWSTYANYIYKASEVA